MRFFVFRGPVKYFESAPPELGRLGDSKQFFKSSLIMGYDISTLTHYNQNARKIKCHFIKAEQMIP